MPALPANAWKILTLIIRQTADLHKESEALSYEQIKKGTGIRSDTTVCKMLSILAQKSLICKKKPADWRSNHYRLNTNSIHALSDDYTEKFEVEQQPDLGQESPSTPKNEVEPQPDLGQESPFTPKYEVEHERSFNFLELLNALQAFNRQIPNPLREYQKYLWSNG